MNELATLPFNNGGGYSRGPKQGKITKFLIYETGSYHQQWYRPFGVESDGSVVSLMQEQLAGEKHFSAMSFSGLSQQFVKPVANINPQRDKIDIVNGWENRRDRFMLEVEIETALGTSNRMIITGWTDAPDGVAQASMVQGTQAQQLLVSPDTRFFISTIIPIQVQTIYGPQGATSSTSVVQPVHLLADSNFSNIYNPNYTERMRPTDLFASMSTGPVDALRDSNGSIPGMGQVFDGRMASTNQAALSIRGNVIPSTYIARVTENYSNAKVADLAGQSNGDLFTQARMWSRDGLAGQNDFLSAMSSIRDEPAGNVFTFRNLQRLDPNMAPPVGVVSGMTQKIQGLHDPMMSGSQAWHGSGPLTLNATIISQAVPALMTELGLTAVDFKMTNAFAMSGMYSAFNAQTHLSNVDNIPPYIWGNAQGFSGQDLTPAMGAFELRFWGEVFKEMVSTPQGMYEFQIHVISNLVGETVVNISMHGSQTESFVTPSFCDSLLTPLIAADRGHVSQVASDFNVMLEQILPSNQLNTQGGPLFGGRL